MSPTRKSELDFAPTARLNANEMRQGWHFCGACDGLTVNVNHKNRHPCTCPAWTEQDIAVELSSREKL